MVEYLDSSVIVKWFKKRERFGGAALDLRARVAENRYHFATSEYTVLEVVRALVKAGASRRHIDMAYDRLTFFFSTEALIPVRPGDILRVAKDIECDLNLSAGDAIHLASALHIGCDVFWSMDHDHLKASAVTYMSARGVAVRGLFVMTD